MRIRILTRRIAIERTCAEPFASRSTRAISRHITVSPSLQGDGTVLHLASLFDEDVPLPPVMSFAMGTLGFLTPFDVKNHQELLSRWGATPLVVSDQMQAP